MVNNAISSDSNKISISSWLWDFLIFFIFVVLSGYSIHYAMKVPNVLLEQGLSHRIFYFHVPVAWVALYGPLFSFIASIFYLLTRNLKFDRMSFALNQVSLIFAIGVLFSGPIWAYSAWGVPWDWTDARLQSFFILCLSLFGYFIFRSLIPNPIKKAMIGAYLTILCGVNAVLTWGAIRWIDNPGNHPSSVLGKGGMETDMRIAFYLNVLAFHILFLVFIRIAYRLENIQNFRNIIKASMDDE
ncbi:cytochrome c biogenesis protein [Leptospira sp. GIMC2001]|uniref:cytochrome c biogenesis protein n=1 Tax=Leptospira sp. GIMC2001 TaxID=1513297 RepID=UPI002349F895|nr:cytochrome c biogenesis protein [Leptospira sp. GIMC2001]WCL51124.1 cytochrome c biogenesis protein [Leptospira sp. GIMC2001]